MARIRILKETPTFVFDTTNPRPNVRGGDCVVRSISLASGKSWVEVFDGLVEIGRREGRMPNDRVVLEKYLKKEGWIVCKQPRHKDRTKIRAKEFVESIAKGKRCIISMTRHLTCCLEDKKIHDIWDCSNQIVGKYWIKG